MLILLTPELIEEHWGMIAPAIEASVVGEGTMSAVALLSIKEQAKAGNARILAIIKDEVPVGLVVAYVQIEPVALKKSLLLYAVYGFDKLSLGDLVEGIKEIVAAAKEVGCTSIHALSDDERMIKLVGKLGFSTNVRLLTLEI